MATTELEISSNVMVGAKQTKLAIERGEAEKVFIAEDEMRIWLNPLQSVAGSWDSLVSVTSMRELAKLADQVAPQQPPWFAIHRRRSSGPGTFTILFKEVQTCQLLTSW